MEVKLSAMYSTQLEELYSVDITVMDKAKILLLYSGRHTFCIVLYSKTLARIFLFSDNKYDML